VGQCEERAEEGELGLAEAFDVGPAVGAAEGGAESHDDEVEQAMAFGTVDAGVGKIVKVGCKKFLECMCGHPFSPGKVSLLRSIVRAALDGVNGSPNNPLAF
jgi:hypothetical protein